MSKTSDDPFIINKFSYNRKEKNVTVKLLTKCDKLKKIQYVGLSDTEPQLKIKNNHATLNINKLDDHEQEKEKEKEKEEKEHGQSCTDIKNHQSRSPFENVKNSTKDTLYKNKEPTPFDTNTFIMLLNILTNLKITNISIFYFSINYIQNNLDKFNSTHVPILFQFVSEHMFNLYEDLPNSYVFKIYNCLYTILKNNICNFPEKYLTHCSFALACLYFVETILNNCIKNIPLLENIMIMLCNKIRGGFKILTNENREKKASSELICIILKILQLVYMKIEKRLPDDIFNLFKYIEKEYNNIINNEDINNNDNRNKEQFIYFISDFFRKKQINHFLKYTCYPYMIDIVLVMPDNQKNQQTTGLKNKALFVVNNLKNLYLKNVQVTDFTHNLSPLFCTATTHDNNFKNDVSHINTIEGKNNELIYNNNTTTCLKPYEAIREWILNNN
ncbi:conserved protein, unknown function, partial [Hepatocystis sp. ex Piliocolobus tephrosceles]